MKNGFLTTPLLISVLICVLCAGLHAQEAEVLITGSAQVHFEERDKNVLAVLEVAQGDVFHLPVADTLWRPAAVGVLLRKGDRLRTGPASSALVRLSDGSAIRLGPRGALLIDIIMDPEGGTNAAVVLDSGKLWAAVARGGAFQRMFIQAGNGVFDTEQGRVFVEVNDAGVSCADLFSGVLRARSTKAPLDALALDMNQRATVPPEGAIQEPGAFEGDYNDSDFSHSCLDALDEKKQRPIIIQLEDAEDMEIVITAEAVVVFGGGDETMEPVNFVVDESAVPESPAVQTIVISGSAVAVFGTPESNVEEEFYTDGTLVFTAEQSVTESTSEPEYVEIVISAQSTVTFLGREEEEPCTDTPEIASASVNGETVSSGGTVNVVSEDCGQVEISVAGQATAACGSVSVVTAFLDGVSEAVSGTDDWLFSFTPEEAGNTEVQVKATDSTGSQSDVFSFTVSFSRDVGEPVVEVEYVAELAAADITTRADVYRDSLEDGKLVITGTAASDNCEVDRVEVSVDNGASWAQTEDTASWRYEFAPSDGEYDILARAFDTLGTQSQDMFQPVEITYYSKTEEDNLREAFVAMIQAYQDKNTSGFMDYVSSMYSSSYAGIEDYNNLENSLDAKFNYETVYVRYKIDEILITGEEGRVAFNWDAAAGTGYSQYGVFIFNKEGEWRFAAVEDDNTFLRYIPTPVALTLSAGKTTLVVTTDPTTQVTATVRDAGNQFIGDGTEVTFSTTLGTIESSATTLNGEAVVEFDAGNIDGTAVITATVGGVQNTLNIVIKPEHAPLPPDQQE